MVDSDKTQEVTKFDYMKVDYMQVETRGEYMRDDSHQYAVENYEMQNEN